MQEVQTTTYKIVLGISDPGHSLVVERIVHEHPRFVAATIVPNAMTALDAVSHLHPPVVLFSDDSPGVSGTEVLPDMFESSPETIIIMLANGPDTAYLRHHEEIFHAVTLENPTSIVDSLDAAADFLDHPEAAGSLDGPTRRRHDRRVRQDWTQVFAERRGNLRRHDL